MEYSYLQNKQQSTCKLNSLLGERALQLVLVGVTMQGKGCSIGSPPPPQFLKPTFLSAFSAVYLQTVKRSRQLPPLGAAAGRGPAGALVPTRPAPKSLPSVTQEKFIEK